MAEVQLQVVHLLAVVVEVQVRLRQPLEQEVVVALEKVQRPALEVVLELLVLLVLLLRLVVVVVQVHLVVVVEVVRRVQVVEVVCQEPVDLEEEVE